MSIEKTELESMLTVFRDGITKAIEAKAKEQSDSANKEIAEMKVKLADAEKALNDLKEQAKKGFGVPGLEKEKGNFNWGKYFVGLAKDFKVSKGLLDASEAKKHWDGEASFEARVCKDYNATDGSSGGFIVPPQIYQGDVIDVVYANTAILKMPVLKFTGLKNDMPIPVD